MTKPHGLKGDVVVRLVSNRPERMARGSVLSTPAGSVEVVRSSRRGASWIVSFAGVDCRDKAEAMRGTTLSAPPIDDPEVLWVHQLIGRAVLDTHGRSLGRVVAVEDNPASDLLVLGDGAVVPLSFLVEQVDESLVVDPPPGLLD